MLAIWCSLLIVVTAQIVAQAIERARQRAGISHKELAIAQGIPAPQWSQQLGGYPGSHIWLDALSKTPVAFRAALLEELRCAWKLDAPTIADVHALLLTIVRPCSARAATSGAVDCSAQEDRCAG